MTSTELVSTRGVNHDVVCVGGYSDCLDAESWYPGVPLKDVIVVERSSMSTIEREIRRRANISFKTVIRRNYIIRRSGLDYLLLFYPRSLELIRSKVS